MRNPTDDVTPATRAFGSLDNRRPIPLWVKLVVIVGALLSAMGGVLALIKPAMVAPGDAINGAVHIYAGYFAARSLAISVMLIVMLGLGARRALGHMMLLTALVQFFDICMDVAEARWTVIPIVLVLGVAFLLGANRLLGSPFWKLAAWKD